MKVNWICTLTQPGHIAQALVHFNRAEESADKDFSKTEACRSLFDGLNKIQTEWLIQRDDCDMGEVKAFQTMITEVLQQESRETFLQCKELRSFISFSPHIMNHDTLRRHKYRPDEEIDPRLAKKASEEHKRLERAYNDYLTQSSGKTEEERVLKRAAELLYIVRSNIAHGEKTPYGPDVKKIERDELVSAVVVLVQFLLFNLLLDNPDQKLVVYGTLASGEANHRMIADLAGHWEKCVIRGSFHETNGLPMFKWDPSGLEQDAQIFISPELPKKWDQLDRFEGISYQRRLIPTIVKNVISISNIYLDNEC
tara:strand:+ start:59 stop:991 length:933 start_codon:yes stop_codon:yes gene_type:complete